MIKAIEYDNNGVTLTFQGRITSKEILGANTDIINHHSFKEIKYQLWILNDVEDFLLSAVEIKAMADQDSKAAVINPEVKVAIVSKSQLVFGLGRMYEAFSIHNPWEVISFYNLEEALEWIKS